MYTYNGRGSRVNVVQGVTARVNARDSLVSYGDVSYAFAPDRELALKAAGGDTTRYSYDVQRTLTELDLPDGRVIQYVLGSAESESGKARERDPHTGIPVSRTS